MRRGQSYRSRGGCGNEEDEDSSWWHAGGKISRSIRLFSVGDGVEQGGPVNGIHYGLHLLRGTPTKLTRCDSESLNLRCLPIHVQLHTYPVHIRKHCLHECNHEDSWIAKWLRLHWSTNTIVSVSCVQSRDRWRCHHEKQTCAHSWASGVWRDNCRQSGIECLSHTRVNDTSSRSQ